MPITQSFRTMAARLLRMGYYPCRHPLLKGLWSHEWRWFLQPEGADAEAEFLLRMKLDGLVVCDIGANIGLMALFFGRSVGPTGKVLSFEPNPASYERLRRNIDANRFRWVTPFQKALGSQPGIQDLILPGLHLVATFNPQHAQRWIGRSSGRDPITIQVEVDTLDRMVGNCEIPVPHLVKIDVEGFELEVLKGSQQVINQHHPVLFIELHGHTVGPDLATAVMEFLEANRYSVYHVESRQKATVEDFQFVNGHLYCVHPQSIAHPVVDTAL